MPIISNFYGIIIRMYYYDIHRHKLPHIHASYNNNTAIFSLDGELIDGNLPNKQRKMVEAWIYIHTKELAKLWELLVNGEEGFKIKPLK